MERHWGHAGEYGPSQRLGGRVAGLLERRHHKGSHHHPRLPEALGGRIEALAVVAYVGDPVCFGFGFDCDSQGGMGDLEQEQRGVKMLAPYERLLVGGLVVVLQKEGVRRGGQHGGG